MAFSDLLKEAILQYQFETVDDMVKSIKSILRKASFPRYLEKKSGEGFASPSRHGYKYKYMNGVVTISFYGTERSWVSELAKAFAVAKINYHYNEKEEIFMIKDTDNVTPEELLSAEAQDELENGKHHVIGTVVRSKHDIAEIINNFTETQRSVYSELINAGLVKWTMTKYKIGNQQKFKYALKKIGENDNDNV
jgi:hypothetical protein